MLKLILKNRRLAFLYMIAFIAVEAIFSAMVFLFYNIIFWKEVNFPPFMDSETFTLTYFYNAYTVRIPVKGFKKAVAYCKSIKHSALVEMNGLPILVYFNGQFYRAKL